MIILLATLCAAISACQATVTPPAPTGTLTPEANPSATATRGPIPTQRPSQTPSLTTAPSQTPGPSPTSTPQPTLSAHTWQPAPVLIQAARRDPLAHSPFQLDPFFVLYASGELILQQCQGSQCGLFSQQLDTGGVCRLLNRIDQSGFFDYDPATYQPPQSGGTSIILQVNAWRSQAVDLDQLEQWIADPGWFARQQQCKLCPPAPQILPSLLNTYDLLTRYQPTVVKPYVTDRLAVWVSQPWLAGSAQPWMGTDLSLDSLYQASRCRDAGQSQAVILTGSQARQVSERVNAAMIPGSAPIFSEDSLLLQLETRWLLPLEAAPGCGEASNALPAVAAPTPSFTLSCKPSDGLAEIPTLTPTPYRH